MKTLLIFSLSLMLMISAEIQEQIYEKGTFEVQLSNLQIQKGGKVYIAVYDKEENFMTEKRLKGLMVEVDGKNTKLNVNIDGLPNGEYVLTAFHDTNGNGKMDFDAYGRPLEAWATSGVINPYGPPTWENAKIHLKDDRMNINLDFKN